MVLLKPVEVSGLGLFLSFFLECRLKMVRVRRVTAALAGCDTREQHIQRIEQCNVKKRETQPGQEKNRVK